MVLHLLITENEERRCIMVERLLDDPEDVLHFYDKTRISKYRLPRNRNWNQHYRDQQKRHGALLVVVQVTNALHFFCKRRFSK